jgi:hypothetical protein
MFQRYVASDSYGCCKSRLRRCICCKCFRGMLQAFIQSVSSVSNVRCKRFDLDVVYVSHMLQEYVPNVSVVSFLCCSKYFMLQVFLSGCCICFTHMLQVYVPNVSYASDLCCFQKFHVASVSCCKYFMLLVSWGTGQVPEKGHGELEASRWGARRA